MNNGFENLGLYNEKGYLQNQAMNPGVQVSYPVVFRRARTRVKQSTRSAETRTICSSQHRI